MTVKLTARNVEEQLEFFVLIRIELIELSESSAWKIARRSAQNEAK